MVAIQGWGLFGQAARLDGANLTAANLEFARLSGAKLQRANLTAANLEMTWLSKADLSHANLTDANLQEGKLNEANLAGATLTGARRHYATFQGTYMEDCLDCPRDWEQ